MAGFHVLGSKPVAYIHLLNISLAHALSLYAVVVFIRRPSSELDLIRVSPTRRFFSSLLRGSSSQAGQEEAAAGEARETKAAATYP